MLSGPQSTIEILPLISELRFINWATYLTFLNELRNKDKKYYVILKNGKIIHYGNINYQDYLIHQDDKRRDNFKKRFYKQYIKIKDNIESPLYWSYNILW